MVLRKKCIKSSHQRIYKEGDEGFDEEFCISCGAPLMEYDEIPELKINKVNETDETKKEESEKVFYINECNEIRFFEIHGAPVEIPEVEDNIEGPRVVIYKKAKIVKVVPIEYDETLIGRKSLNVEPEIDLSFIDENRFSSRKHALIYINNGEYFIKRLSVKNSLHVNLTAVDETGVKLNDGDIINLSRKFALEFRM